MGNAKWGCLGIILYLCRNIIGNIIYVLCWGLVAVVCYLILQIL